MSSKISGKVWDLDLPHAEQYVLLAMADHADHEGRNVRPSVGLIAWKTGYSPRQVHRIVQSLRSKEILVPDGFGPNGVLQYCIDLARAPLKTPYTSRDAVRRRHDKMAHLTPVKMAHPEPRQNGTGVTPGSHRGYDIAMSYDPSLNLKEEGKEIARDSDSPPGGSAGVSQNSVNDDRDRLLDACGITYARDELRDVPPAIILAAIDDVALPADHRHYAGRIAKRLKQWKQGQWQPAQPSLPPVRSTPESPATRPAPDPLAKYAKYADEDNALWLGTKQEDAA